MAKKSRNAARSRGSRLLIPFLLLALFVSVVGGSYWALTIYDAGLRTGTCSARGLDTSHTYSTKQTTNAAIIAAVSVDRGLPARAASIALATAYQESKLENINYGDRDSIGLFQQRPSQGWGTEEQIMDPIYAATKFYEALEKVDGYVDMPITEAAQKVQRSGYPEAYADHETEGRLFASALAGKSGGELQCDLTPAGGPGNPDVIRGLLEEHYVNLTSSGEVSAKLTGAGSDAPHNAGGTTLQITVGNSTQGWSIANWAVAMAADNQIVAVDYQGERWDRTLKASNETSQWVAHESSDPDTVIIYVASGSK